MHSSRKRNFLGKFLGVSFHRFKILRSSIRSDTSRLLTITVIVLALLFSPFVLNSIFIRADVSDFYPETCLGDWQNPQNAQSQPETFGSDGQLFTQANSSIYTKEAKNIFCGNFVPQDYEGEGEIKNVGLTLVWHVGESQSQGGGSPSPVSIPVSTTPEPVIDLPVPATTTESNDPLPPIATSTDQTPSEGPLKKEVAPPEPLPSPPPTEEAQTTSQIVEPAPPAENSAPQSYLHLPLRKSFSIFRPLLNQVLAQELENREEKLVPQSEVSSSPISEETKIVPPEDKDEGMVSSTKENPTPQSEVEPIINDTTPDDNFLKINYSFDGETWVELAKVNESNWRNYTVTLPVRSWDELRRLQISVEGIPTTIGEIPKAYLDGMLVEVHYDLPPLLSRETTIQPIEENGSLENTPRIITLPDGKKPLPTRPNQKDFGPSETPSFDLNLDDLPIPSSTIQSSFSPPAQSQGPASYARPQKSHFAWLGFFLNLFRNSAEAQSNLSPGNLPTLSNPIIARIIGPDGKETNIEPILLNVNNQLRISIPEPEREFHPGRYTLRLWILKNSVIYFTENDFTWGVLAVNFNKSIYAIGDTARIGFGVLDDQGHTICNANIETQIKAPSGRTIFLSTANKKIKRNLSCGPETVTNEPDYSASIKADESGTYEVSVSARTPNGGRTITDIFRVEQAPRFSVERIGPTRIFPPAIYKMTMHIVANEDYAGEIREIVPLSFNITNELNSKKENRIHDQTITWNVNVKAGESAELNYFFKAPNVSPELYKLGALEIGSWQESRKWQIAADAAGEVILLWDGATIPNGWTCISCVATDPFFGVFPRASSTYGSASSSADNVTHTLTFSSYTQGTGIGINTAAIGTFSATEAHTHTWGNPTLASEDIRPIFGNLKFISAATTTLPNGTIGIFDVAVASLPSGWSSYSAFNGDGISPLNVQRYLRGDADGLTGGASTHNPTTTAALTSGASAGRLDDSGNGKNTDPHLHDHTIPAASTIGADNNTPPFITVVFAQLGATSSIPDGLIALFDNASLPSNWSIVSTSGSAYAGKFLKGASSFGSTGGSSTHNHTASTTFANIASNSGNAVNKSGTAANAADTSHTHSVTYTVSSATSLPVYRDVILGKYTAPAGGSAPTVSGVTINSSTAIILTPAATTTIIARASTSDPDGAGDIRYATSTIYRSGAGGTANCPANNSNCYQLASSSCSFTDSTSTVSCSAEIYYFADATDASSSYSGENWLARITVTDASSNATASTTASGVEMSTLLAIDVTTSSINYGSLTPSSTTGGTNQILSIKNVGNSSSTLKISGTALTLGSNSIATSSQHYATSTFTFGGFEQVLSSAATAVSGFLLTSPTSTNTVSSPTYWGIEVSTGKATGTYTGVNTFTAVFSP
ncbi:MAG: hypothetical protein AAB652_01850 [Patescibacteria group bacterium]